MFFLVSVFHQLFTVTAGLRETLEAKEKLQKMMEDFENEKDILSENHGFT